MVALAQYWASVGIRTEEADLKKVDALLSKIESKLKKALVSKPLSVNIKADEGKFNKHIQGILSRAGKSTPFKLANVTTDASKLSASVKDVFAKAQFKAPIVATISKASLQTIRSQVQAALQGITIGVRTASVSSRGAGGSQGTGSVAASRRASLTGRGDPSLQEFLMGKSSLSAGHRRYVDAILGKSIKGVGGNSITGMAVQGGIGGLARVGSGSMVGRMAGMTGMALGGPLGATMGMVGAGVVSLATSAFKGIWSTLGTVITAPFKLISSAASMVTGAFYKLALAATPLVMGFNAIDKRVRQTTLQGVALDAAVKDFGSTGKQERDWLMDMSNRSGVEYSSVVEPYTTFISASAPAMGLEQSKGIFEALTQYGSTHGANTFSMNNALKAFGQMSAKGTVQLEELKNQVGDAKGFGGMMPIFAEAWQRLQGRTGDKKLTGQKALEELLKAIENRQLIASKILPVVEKIAREKSAGSIEARKESSEGQRATFMNQIIKGWQNFTEGGGESGLQFFWQMMQRMGQWWIDNGSSLGSAFETAVYWLDAVRLGAYELASFVRTGENNSFVEWASEWGINLQEFRNSVMGMVNQVVQIFKGGEDSSWIKTITTKLQNFSIALQEMFVQLSEMLEGIQRFAYGYQKWSDAPLWRKLTLTAFEGQGMMIQGAAKATWNAGQATLVGGGALMDLATKNTSNAISEYQLYGDGKGGFTPRTDPYKAWIEGMTFNPTKSDDSKQLTITKPNPVITNALPPSVVIKQPELLQKQTTPSTYVPVVKPLVMPQTFIKPKYPIVAPLINTVMEAYKNYSATSNISNTVNNTVNNMQPTSLPSYAGGVMNQTAQQQVQTINQNVNVKLDVQGNAAAITALIDDRTRTQLPILLLSMITKEITAAPVSR